MVIMEYVSFNEATMTTICRVLERINTLHIGEQSVNLLYDLLRKSLHLGYMYSGKSLMEEPSSSLEVETGSIDGRTRPVRFYDPPRRLLRELQHMQTKENVCSLRWNQRPYMTQTYSTAC